MKYISLLKVCLLSLFFAGAPLISHAQESNPCSRRDADGTRYVAGCCQVWENSAPPTWHFEETPSCDACYEKNKAATGRNWSYDPGRKPTEDKKGCFGQLQTGEEDTVLEPSKITPPVLAVSIPGFKQFSEVSCITKDNCNIPWIGEYLLAIYNYSMLAISLIAVIMLMVGGIMYVTAAGNRESMGRANGYIRSSVAGLALAFCSYLVLFLVNPKLTIFNPLELNYISQEIIKVPPEIDLSKGPNDQDADQSTLELLRKGNPYQAGCGNRDVCAKFGNTRPSGIVQIAPEHTAKSAGGVQYINPEIYEAFKRVLACVNKNKIMFTIYDGQRTAASQIDKKNRLGGLAAEPCCSNHGAGIAMDLRVAPDNQMSWGYNDSSGLTKCMNQNGLFAKVKSEPWHWSPSGR